MKYIILALIFCVSCATIRPRPDNDLIDNTIDDLKTVETKTPAEKSAVKRAIIQLEQTKEVNDENAELKKQIKKDAKYVKTGKLAIGGFVLFGLCAVGLFVFKLIK